MIAHPKRILFTGLIVFNLAPSIGHAGFWGSLIGGLVGGGAGGYLGARAGSSPDVYVYRETPQYHTTIINKTEVDYGKIDAIVKRRTDEAADNLFRRLRVQNQLQIIEPAIQKSERMIPALQDQQTQLFLSETGTCVSLCGGIDANGVLHGEIVSITERELNGHDTCENPNVTPTPAERKAKLFEALKAKCDDDRILFRDVKMKKRTDNTGVYLELIHSRGPTVCSVK